mgnify:CR=1 FL=1
MPKKSALRGAILQALHAQEWISGEALAKRLGVSRAAISKQIAGLRACGCLVDAASRRGYRLVSLAEPWALQDMQAGLKTHCLGRGEWLWLDKTDSTNLALLRRALEGAKAGAVAVARHQTAGRGSKNRTWTDMPGCLMFSVLLRPPMPMMQPEGILGAALQSCQSTLAGFCSVDARIKPPNDILLGSRKIGGVLVESLHRNGEIAGAVLGIGLNVNVPPADMPVDLRAAATSVYAESGRTFDLGALLADLLANLETALGAGLFADKYAGPAR